MRFGPPGVSPPRLTYVPYYFRYLYHYTFIRLCYFFFACDLAPGVTCD